MKWLGKSVRILFVSLIGAAVVLAVLFVVSQAVRDDGTVDRPNAKPGFNNRELLVDTVLQVPAGGIIEQSFEVGSRRNIMVKIEGVLDTDKGLDIYVGTAGFPTSLKGEPKLEYYPEWKGVRNTSWMRTGEFGRGKHAVALVNRYNIINTAEVRVRVIADPSSSDLP